MRSVCGCLMVPPLLRLHTPLGAGGGGSQLSLLLPGRVPHDESHIAFAQTECPRKLLGGGESWQGFERGGQWGSTSSLSRLLTEITRKERCLPVILLCHGVMSVCHGRGRHGSGSRSLLAKAVHIPANQGAEKRQEPDPATRFFQLSQLPKTVAQGYSASEEQYPASAEGSPAPRERGSLFMGVTQLTQPHCLFPWLWVEARRKKHGSPRKLVQTRLGPCAQGSGP